MSSGFSEYKGFWGLLSLAGSQNLSQVDLILHLNAYAFFCGGGGGGGRGRINKVHYWQCEDGE